MRNYKFRVAVPDKQYTFNVEADSMVEAQYEAKQRVLRWLDEVGSDTGDLTEFDLLAVVRI